MFTGTAVAERRAGFTVYYDFDVREIFRGDSGAKTTLSTNELTRAATLKQFGEPRAVTADERAAADYPQGLSIVQWVGIGAAAGLFAAGTVWILRRARH